MPHSSASFIKTAFSALSEIHSTFPDSERQFNGVGDALSKPFRSRMTLEFADALREIVGQSLFCPSKHLYLSYRTGARVAKRSVHERLRSVKRVHVCKHRSSFIDKI